MEVIQPPKEHISIITPKKLISCVPCENCTSCKKLYFDKSQENQVGKIQEDEISDDRLEFIYRFDNFHDQIHTLFSILNIVKEFFIIVNNIGEGQFIDSDPDYLSSATSDKNEVSIIEKTRRYHTNLAEVMLEYAGTSIQNEEIPELTTRTNYCFKKEFLNLLKYVEFMYLSTSYYIFNTTCQDLYNKIFTKSIPTNHNDITEDIADGEITRLCLTRSYVNYLLNDCNWDEKNSVQELMKTLQNNTQYLYLDIVETEFDELPGFSSKLIVKFFRLYTIDNDGISHVLLKIPDDPFTSAITKVPHQQLKIINQSIQEIIKKIDKLLLDTQQDTSPKQVKYDTLCENIKPIIEKIDNLMDKVCFKHKKNLQSTAENIHKKIEFEKRLASLSQKSKEGTLNEIIQIVNEINKEVQQHLDKYLNDNPNATPRKMEKISKAHYALPSTPYYGGYEWLKKNLEIIAKELKAVFKEIQSYIEDDYLSLEAMLLKIVKLNNEIVDEIKEEPEIEKGTGQTHRQEYCKQLKDILRKEKNNKSENPSAKMQEPTLHRIERKNCPINTVHDNAQNIPEVKLHEKSTTIHKVTSHNLEESKLHVQTNEGLFHKLQNGFFHYLYFGGIK